MIKATKMAGPELLPYKMLLRLGLTSAYWGTRVLCGLGYQSLISGPWNVFTSKKRDQKPKCLEDPALGEHGFIKLKHQNMKLHYVAKGPKDKPLMLFLHGFPEFWYSWRHQIKEFSQSYRTVAIDMRGFAESDKPEGITEYHIENLVEDVKDVVTGLGYESCVLVAHDWGGSIAFVFTMKYPHMVHKLVACNIPHPSALRKHMVTEKSQHRKSWYIYFFQNPYLPEIFIRSNDYKYLEEMYGFNSTVDKPWMANEDLEAYKYALSLPGATENPVNYYRAAWRYKQAKIPSTRIKGVPTLIIWGTGDISMEKETATMSKKYINNCTVHFIEGGSHFIQQEKPQLVNQYMWDFLQNSPARYSKL